MDLDRFTWSGDHPYCRAHESHYCPCLKPERYDPLDKKDAEYLRGWADIAPIVPFTGARPTERVSVSVNDVVEIPQGQWEVLVADAARKDARSNQAAWTRRWGKDFNLKGEIGEWLYEYLTGIPRKHGFGDGGQDFPLVDVKTTAYWNEPWLRVPPNEPMRALFYALVATDIDRRICRYVGHATRAEVEAAPLKDLGKGIARVLERLDPELPPIQGAR